MPSSLIREHHIVITASLAATLGLEQAVMLQVLGDCLRHRSGQHRDGYRWITLPKAELTSLLPFWSEQDIDRISHQLQSQGIIQLGSATLMLADSLVFALNEPSQAPAAAPTATVRSQPTPTMAPAPAAAPAQARPGQGARQIPADWQPGNELLRKLREINGIDPDFALQLVPEFITYWRDRQATTFSWESRFMNHAQRLWLQQGSQRDNIEAAASAAKQGCAMSERWRPSDDAMDILLRSGIQQQFVEDAIPEFILYWRDRGDISNTWDTRFIAHIRRQWARYESSTQFDTEPQRIASDWQPSEDVYDILRMANIDVDFARDLLPEFVVYWRDTNQAYSSWSTRFLQHIKTRWARRLNGQDQNRKDYGQKHQSAVEPDSRSFVDKHTDQSWREGL
jgi:hypothetical protein